MVTRAQHITRVQNAVSLIYAMIADGVSYPALVDAVRAGTATDFSEASNAAAQRFGKRIAGLIDSGGELLGTELQAFAETETEVEAADAQAALTLLYRRFSELPLRVRSRGITFGSVTADGGNSFNGVVQRQTVDENGDKIEAVNFETKRFECVSDARTGGNGDQRGLPHEEFWTLAGEVQSTLGIIPTGYGKATQLKTKSSIEDNGLRDPWTFGASFTTAPTAGSPQAAVSIAQGWSATTLSKLRFDVDTLPRTYRRGDATPTIYKVVFGDPLATGTANNALSQAASSWRARTLDLLPVHAEVWLRRRSSADGTATITLGSQTNTVNVGVTLVNDTWTRFRLSDGTDSKGWPRVWNSTTAGFSIALTGNTTGSLEVAYPAIFALDQFNGTFWGILPGTAEAKVTDSFEVTDALTATDSKFQQLLARIFKRFLPHCGTATPVTASGGRTFTFAAAGKTLTASSGSFVSDGYKPGMRVTIAGTSSNNGGKLVATVAATVLTFASTETLVDEGPLSATANITGVPYLEDP